MARTGGPSPLFCRSLTGPLLARESGSEVGAYQVVTARGKAYEEGHTKCISSGREMTLTPLVLLPPSWMLENNGEMHMRKNYPPTGLRGGLAPPPQGRHSSTQPRGLALRPRSLASPEGRGRVEGVETNPSQGKARAAAVARVEPLRRKQLYPVGPSEACRPNSLLVGA